MTNTKESAIVIQIDEANAEAETAISLKNHFLPFEEQANEWKEKATELVVTDETQVDLMRSAREARLALKNIRVSVDKKHKELKADVLKKGQLLDSIKRTLTGMIEPIEKHLQEQEDFVKLREQERKLKLQSERSELLFPFMGDNVHSMPLADMNEDAFNFLLSGQKLAHEQKIAEAKRIEQERIEREEKERKEQERIRRENEKLKVLQTRVNRLTSIDFKYNETSTSYNHEGIQYGLLKSKIQKMDSEEFESLFADLSKMVNKFNQAEQKKKEALESKLQKERDERIRLEKEARERDEILERERKAKQAAERKAKRAPDKDKLILIADEIQVKKNIFALYTLKDEDAAKILNNAIQLLEKTEKYIRDNAEKL